MFTAFPDTCSEFEAISGLCNSAIQLTWFNNWVRFQRYQIFLPNIIEKCHFILIHHSISFVAFFNCFCLGQFRDNQKVRYCTTYFSAWFLADTSRLFPRILELTRSNKSEWSQCYQIELISRTNNYQKYWNCLVVLYRLPQPPEYCLVALQCSLSFCLCQLSRKTNPVSDSSEHTARSRDRLVRSY